MSRPLALLIPFTLENTHRDSTWNQYSCTYSPVTSRLPAVDTFLRSYNNTVVPYSITETTHKARTLVTVEPQVPLVPLQSGGSDSSRFHCEGRPGKHQNHDTKLQHPLNGTHDAPALPGNTQFQRYFTFQFVVIQIQTSGSTTTMLMNKYHRTKSCTMFHNTSYTTQTMALTPTAATEQVSQEWAQ